MLHMMLIAALVASAAPEATAVAATDQPAAAAQVKKKQKEKKVCRREVPTGSIMAERTCKSQREWDELTASGQDTLRQVRDRSSSTMGIPAN